MPRRIASESPRADRRAVASSSRPGDAAARRSSTARAGEYTLDYWKARVGAGEPKERLELYNRAAAHQTTADNPGLLPTPIVQPVVNFIDVARPLDDMARPQADPVQHRGSGRR